MSNIELLSKVISVAFILAVIIQAAPLMAWVERRGSAMMQNRKGPNRIGPFGLFQSIADGIKFAFKEDRTPGHVNKFYYTLAPLVSMIPTLLGAAVIPFAKPLEIGGEIMKFQIADLNVGLLYVYSIASLGIYGIIMGGWASNNKYALLGSIRSSSQMISYELSLGLSVVGIIMTFASVNLNEIVAAQGQLVTHIGALQLPEWLHIPKWGIFVQPIGFVIFLACGFAETNRLPFDLPEGESEIVAGYHLEYGSLKFAMFQIAEYGNMTIVSAMATTMYFGGWHGLEWVTKLLPLQGFELAVASTVLSVAAFMLKVSFFMWFFVWVRWTLPRFRYDQVMDLGWKVMLPLSLLNIFATGVAIYLGWI